MPKEVFKTAPKEVFKTAPKEQRLRQHLRQSKESKTLPHEERVLLQEHSNEMMAVSVLLIGTGLSCFSTSSNKMATLAVMILEEQQSML